MDLSEAARLVETSPDFRLLRRVPPPRDWPLNAASAETRRGVFVDTETTGLDLDTDEVIELALLPFEYERDTGAIVSVDQDAALNAFREPSFPIPPESAKIHGITDEMVRGRAIDPEHVRSLIEPAHLVLAHNAAFDRPMVEKHWPIFARQGHAPRARKNRKARQKPRKLLNVCEDRSNFANKLNRFRTSAFHIPFVSQ
jgi:DNA polymerase-3 subunit epsilon